MKKLLRVRAVRVMTHNSGDNNSFFVHLQHEVRARLSGAGGRAGVGQGLEWHRLYCRLNNKITPVRAARAYFYCGLFEYAMEDLRQRLNHHMHHYEGAREANGSRYAAPSNWETLRSNNKPRGVYGTCSPFRPAQKPMKVLPRTCVISVQREEWGISAKLNQSKKCDVLILGRVTHVDLRRR